MARVAHVAAAGFLSCYLNVPLQYVRNHITVYKNVSSVSLNKAFSSFHPLEDLNHLKTTKNILDSQNLLLSMASLEDLNRLRTTMNE